MLKTISTGFLALLLAVLPAVAQLSTDSRIGPTAIFTADPSFVPVGATVTVDARASHDSGGSSSLEYRWHFGEIGATWTEWTRRSTATKVYEDDGQARIRLQVRDRDGYIDETVNYVTVRQFTGDQKPWARFFVSAEEGDTETLFTFTVQPFSAVNTPVDKLEVSFDWDKDGTADTSWSTARTFTHSFPETGYREVWLYVRDPVNGMEGVEKGFYVQGEENDSLRTKEIGRIFIEQSTRPRASFRTYPSGGIEVGQILHLDAVDSLRETEYRWDLDGDGDFDTPWFTEPALQHRFGEAGTYDVTLEVKNAKGETDRTERQIVIEPKDVGPVAKLKIRNTRSPSEQTLGLITESFTFDASSSRDEDGSTRELSYRFDFEGDGVFDTTFGVETRVTHQYERVGEYAPVVEVRDGQGLTAQAEAYIRVVENTPPLITLTASRDAVLTDDELQFTATVDDGQTRTSDLRVRFDFDGDGAFDTPWQKNARERYHFDRPGTFVVTAEVKDAGNAIARATTTVRVVANRAPIASLSVAPRAGVLAESAVFDASATFDPTGLAGPLQYRWNFDAIDYSDITFDSGWSRNATVQRRYREPGEYLVHVAVKNRVGDIADAWGTLTIHEGSEDMTYLLRRGIISHYDPAAELTRAEFAALLVNATATELPELTQQPFPDVSAGDWFAAAAVTAVERQWLSVRDDFDFDPEATVPRAEAARAIIAALFPGVPSRSSASYFPDVPSVSPFNRVARVADAFNLVPGQHFRPAAPVTRGDASIMIAGLLRQYDNGTFAAADVLGALLSLIR